MVSRPGFTLLKTNNGNALVRFPDRSFHVFLISEVDEAFRRLWANGQSDASNGDSNNPAICLRVSKDGEESVDHMHDDQFYEPKKGFTISFSENQSPESDWV
jgi:hypothetical protein